LVRRWGRARESESIAPRVKGPEDSFRVRRRPRERQCPRCRHRVRRTLSLPERGVCRVSVLLLASPRPPPCGRDSVERIEREYCAAGNESKGLCSETAVGQSRLLCFWLRRAQREDFRGRRRRQVRKNLPECGVGRASLLTLARSTAFSSVETVVGRPRISRAQPASSAAGSESKGLSETIERNGAESESQRVCSAAHRDREHASEAVAGRLVARLN
jgi:hypothetical protein